MVHHEPGTESETSSLSFIDSSKLFWYLWRSDFKSFFNNFTYFVINHDFFVITFWIDYALFVIIFGRNKIAIVNWIFLVPGFFRSFMIPVKYGLILLRNFPTSGVLFLSPLLSYSIYLLLQKLLTLTGL